VASRRLLNDPFAEFAKDLDFDPIDVDGSAKEIEQAPPVDQLFDLVD